MNSTQEIISTKDGLTTDAHSCQHEPNLPQWIYNSLMKEPHNWIQNDHTLMHTRTRLELWTANSRFDLQIYRPQQISLPWYWKRKIWKAYKTRWQRLTVRDVHSEAH